MNEITNEVLEAYLSLLQMERDFLRENPISCSDLQRVKQSIREVKLLLEGINKQGDYINSMRTSLGLSMRDLAGIMGISPELVRVHEHNEFYSQKGQVVHNRILSTLLRLCNKRKEPVVFEQNKIRK